MSRRVDAGHHPRVSVQWDVKIPMRDGVHLAANIYLPTGLDTPSAAVFVLTPYTRQTCHSVAVAFASAGLPFVCVDVRGRGDSGGEFAPYSTDGQDAYDVTEWVAAQSYCTGKVGMWGGSYSGFVQWAAAATRPPHLATIAPAAAPLRGLDSPMRNNIFAPYRLQWLNLIAGRTSQDKVFSDQTFWNHQFRQWFESGAPFRSIDRFLGFESEVFQEWIAHPHASSWWSEQNPCADDYAAINFPVLTITGAYDGDQPGALAHYRAHIEATQSLSTGSHYLVIGPWDHAGTRTPEHEFAGIRIGEAGVIDLIRLHLEWYNWTLCDGTRPTFLKKQISYYVLGAEEWRYADTLEKITTNTMALYLTSDGNADEVFHSGKLLSDLPSASDPDVYVYNPADFGDAVLEEDIDPWHLTDERMVHARCGRQLIYHSAPLKSDILLAGFPRLEAWVAIDQPDTDFQVRLYEIGADGRSTLLSSDILRARHRNSLSEEELVTTCEPLKYEFSRFLFVAREIPKGHRIRLVFGPIHSIFSQRNHNSGGIVADETLNDARTVTVKLFHDETHLSRLYLPIGGNGGVHSPGTKRDG